ncbi:MAG: glycine cleavage system protein GcvH [Alphaproteobacteria bacterium]
MVRYTSEHEWIRLDGDVGVVGITDHAQEQLGDIVFVELPEVGKVLSQGDEAAVVESVKAAAEIYAPVDGEVVEVNEALNDNPGLVNSSSMDDGWFMRIKVNDPSQLDELMDEDAYMSFVEEAG